MHCHSSQQILHHLHRSNRTVLSHMHIMVSVNTNVKELTHAKKLKHGTVVVYGLSVIFGSLPNSTYRASEHQQPSTKTRCGMIQNNSSINISQIALSN